MAVVSTRLNHATKTKILYLVSLSSFLRSFAQNNYLPFLVTMRGELGTTTTMLGFTLSVYGLCLALSQIIYGPIADRFDSKKILLVGIGLFVLGSVGGYYAPNVEALLVARAAQSLGIASAIVGIAIISDLFPASERGQAIGVFSIFSTTGAAIGPAIAAVLAAWLTWRQDFLALAVIGVALAGLIQWQVPAQPVHGQAVGLLEMLTIGRTPATFGVLVLGLTQFWGINTSHTLTPVLLAERLHAGEGEIGFVVACVPLGIIAGSWLGGMASDRYGLRLPLIAGAMGSAVMFLVVSVVSFYATSATTAFAIAIPLFGFGLTAGFGGPAQLNLMVNFFPTMRATAGGLQLFARNIGATLAPVTAGYLADHIGLSVGFGLATALIAIGMLVALPMLRQPRSVVERVGE